MSSDTAAHILILLVLGSIAARLNRMPTVIAPQQPTTRFDRITAMAAKIAGWLLVGVLAYFMVR